MGSLKQARQRADGSSVSRLTLVATLAVLAVAGAAAAVLLTRDAASARERASLCPRTPIEKVRDGFREPRELRSRDGVLSVTLRARPARAFISRPGIRSDLYDGQYPAPTLRVCPGDTLRIKLVNDLSKPTNLHVHGMHVSPRNPSDDVLISIPPGGSHQYVYKVPRDQTPGMYWYHPHRHKLTDPQVFSGMAGALIVEGSGYDDRPGIAGVPERTIVVQENQIADGRVIDPSKVSNRKVRMLVNGRLRQRLGIAPGQIQRWRILNASADRFVRLRIPGQMLDVISEDGNPRPAPSPRRTVLIPAGGRREVLVRGGRRSTQLQTLAFRQPFDNTRRQTLISVRATGRRITGQRMPRTLGRLPDLRRGRVDRRRVIRLESDFPRFLVNGKTFDPRRVDQTMKLGALEQWTIRNDSGEWHSFHIHVNPVQVVRIGRRAVRSVDYEDVVAIPPRGSVTLRMRFTDFTGKFVFHCHILGHEDGGMMSLVQVVR